MLLLEIATSRFGDIGFQALPDLPVTPRTIVLELSASGYRVERFEMLDSTAASADANATDEVVSRGSIPSNSKYGMREVLEVADLHRYGRRPRPVAPGQPSASGRFISRGQ